MRKRLRTKAMCAFALAAAAAMCLCGCAGKPQEPTDPEDLASRTRVVGYLPDWSYSFYRKLDFTALTHLNVAFCNPNGQGELSCSIPDADMADLVARAHAADVKVLAALGGGGGCDGYLPLLDTPEEMAEFNAKIIQYCGSHGLDGIDLDIELASNHKIWEYYAGWVRSLRALCDERGYVLTAATAQWVSEKVAPETYACFDFVNVMAYDDDADSASHSSYAFAEASLGYFLTQKGIEREKLVLGVPFYGRGYRSNGSLNWDSYVPFSDLIAVDVGNFHADLFEGVAYNGAELMREKCMLAKQYGGIMIWEVSLDAEGEYSLLAVIKGTMSETEA